MTVEFSNWLTYAWERATKQDCHYTRVFSGAQTFSLYRMETRYQYDYPVYIPSHPYQVKVDLSFSATQTRWARMSPVEGSRNQYIVEQFVRYSDCNWENKENYAQAHAGIPMDRTDRITKDGKSSFTKEEALNLLAEMERGWESIFKMKINKTQEFAGRLYTRLSSQPL